METQSNITYSGNPKSRSLRVTLPKEITNVLNLEVNDKLTWTVEAENNELKVSVKKSE